MRKIYLAMFTVFILGISSQSMCASNIVSANQEVSIHKHPKGKHPKGKNVDPRKERENDINYKLDVLDAKYKRDKNRINYSDLDKYDKNVKKKELEQIYKTEKNKLKEEKDRVKKENFYSN